MVGRDRLRELLDAVLDEQHATLEQMAGGACVSPYHFSRQLSAGAGEPPVAMRRRVMLERAAWQLRQGTSVTDAAFAAGYDSVEGFSRAYTRAYGHPPSQPGLESHWLPAPNGIHFHPAWDDLIVGALCEPPESFVVGSILADVLIYAAHRRLTVRAMLRELGHETDEGDPITWVRRRSGGTA